MQKGQKNISNGYEPTGERFVDTINNNYTISSLSQNRDNMPKNMKFALNYFENGWFPIPLCWVKEGGCGCHHHHTDPHDIGKAPLVNPNERPTKEKIIRWWTQYPHANIGILLEPSNLVCVDADSLDAVDEVNNMRPLPPSPVVATGRGSHRYFKRSQGVPLTRATHKGTSKHIDVFSTGFVVAPPSIHMSGKAYEWSLPPKMGIAEVPRWALDLLGTSEARTYTAAQPPQTREIDVNRLQIAKRIKDIIWSGTGTKYNGQAYESRSEAITAVISALIKKGYEDAVIVSVLTDPSNGISEKVLETLDPDGKRIQPRGARWVMKRIAEQREWIARQDRAKGTTPPTHTSQGGAR